MAQSYMVNGKFVCPELPPSCFGLAVHYNLTADDVASLESEYGLEEIMNTVGIGDRIECGILVVRDKPYKKYQKTTKKRNTKHYDSAVPSIKATGKPGSESRLEALTAFYAIQEAAETNNSPFTCDMAELVSKSAIGKAYEEYHAKDVDVD